MFLRPSFFFAWLFAVVMLAGVAVSTDVIVWNVPSRATSAASTNIPSTVLQVTWSLLVGRVNVYNGRDSANICVQAICDDSPMQFNITASSSAQLSCVEFFAVTSYSFKSPCKTTLLEQPGQLAGPLASLH
jgi:hypothetical protein